MAYIELKDITYESEGSTVLKNISVPIEKGTVTAFLGTPGSGKSTSLKMIAGILIPTRGSILFEGKDIHNMTRKENIEYRRHCGFMFQDSALFANQDIYHNLLLPLQIHFPKMSEKEKNQKVHQVMEMVGYNRQLTIRPSALSIGEQKRVGFGRAIMCDPDVLFLDEPTESLDDETGKHITKLLQDFVKQGKTIVFVSHDNDFVNSFECDKYYYEKGQIIDKILRHEDEMWGDEDL